MVNSVAAQPVPVLPNRRVGPLRLVAAVVFGAEVCTASRRTANGVAVFGYATEEQPCAHLVALDLGNDDTGLYQFGAQYVVVNENGINPTPPVFTFK